jgi:AI-2 transport protein TqsA
MVLSIVPVYTIIDFLCIFLYMKEHRFMAVTLGLLAAIAVAAVFYIARSVVLPIVISIIMVFVLEPLVRLLTKIRVPRPAAVVLVILIIFGIIFLIGLFFINSVQSFMREYSNYISKFQQIFTEINTKYLSRLSIPNDFIRNIDWADTLKQTIINWSGSFFRFLSILAVIILFLFFLFRETPLFKKKLKKAFPVHTGRRIGIVMEHITRQISRYLGIKTMISASTAMLIYVALTIIGMDFALIWAAIAFFFNYIPNIGSLVSAVLTILVGIIQFYPSVGSIMAVAVSVIVIQITLGNLIDPLLQGEQLNLSPVVILFSLLLWGWLWGIAGAFLAVPIVATVRIVCMNIPSLKPVGVMMGGGYSSIGRRRKQAAAREKKERKTG